MVWIIVNYFCGLFLDSSGLKERWHNILHWVTWDSCLFYSHSQLGIFHLFVYWTILTLFCPMVRECVFRRRTGSLTVKLAHQPELSHHAMIHILYFFYSRSAASRLLRWKSMSTLPSRDHSRNPENTFQRETNSKANSFSPNSCNVRERSPKSMLFSKVRSPKLTLGQQSRRNCGAMPL